MKRLPLCLLLVSLTAAAKPPAFNLGKYRETLAKYAAVEADAKAAPLAKAAAKMSRLVLEMRTCEDAALAAKIAETRAFIESAAGLEAPDQKVEFLLSKADSGGVFACPDVEKLAETAAKGDAKAINRYVDLMMKRCRPGKEDFTYARSYERLLDIVEAALKDPVMEKSRPNLEGKRFDLLRNLGRREEAVKLAEDRIAAATDDGTKRRWYVALAGAYRADARRYAEKPSPTFLKKAEEMVVKAGELNKNGPTPDDFLSIAQLRLQIEDYAGAREFVAKSRAGKPNAKTVREGDRVLARAAYAEERWSEAADLWLPFFREKGPNDHELTLRTVQALFAADRRKDAVPLMKWLAAEPGGRYKQTRAQFAKLLKEMGE